MTAEEGWIPAAAWDAAITGPIVPDDSLAFVWIHDWDDPGRSTVDYPTPVSLGQARREAADGVHIWEPGTQPHDRAAFTVRLRPQFAPPVGRLRVRRMVMVDTVDEAGTVLYQRILPEESLR